MSMKKYNANRFQYGKVPSQPDPKPAATEEKIEVQEPTAKTPEIKQETPAPSVPVKKPAQSSSRSAKKASSTDSFSSLLADADSSTLALLLSTSQLTPYDIRQEDQLYKVLKGMELNAQGMTGLPQVSMFLSPREIAAIDKITADDRMKRFAVVRLLIRYGLDHLYPGLLEDPEVAAMAEDVKTRYVDRKSKNIERDRKREA